MRSLITLIEMNQREAEQILDIDHFDPATLKKAYRNAMKSAHPDTGGSTADAQRIGSAYEFLRSLDPSTLKPDQDEPRAPHTNSKPRPDFHNLDYVKYYFKNLKPDEAKQDWTVMNFDGHFFRGMYTIKANSGMFPEVARVMRIWDRFYKSRAVLVGTSQMLDSGKIFVINIDGRNIMPHEIEFDSFNQNPSNDQSFTRSLPDRLQSILDGSEDPSDAPL